MSRNHPPGVVIPVFLLTFITWAGGCKATPPGKWETAIVTRAKHWVFVRDKDAKNPLAPTAEHIAEGKDTFSHYCIACHGLDGQNTGVPFAERMSPPVPSLASPEVQSYSDGQLRWVIENGIFPSGMPASKGILTDEEIWSTVLYVRHLPRAGSLGEPPIYSGEDNTSPSAGKAHER
jgi:mono/diheme cytochrome c family protein